MTDCRHSGVAEDLCIPERRMRCHGQALHARVWLFVRIRPCTMLLSSAGRNIRVAALQLRHDDTLNSFRNVCFLAQRSATA